ncbi:hypothetical protein F753_21650 [Stutzerimonas chloritidismutans AW-1]|uniref:Uncharacterized protein n=1 Tax=Stutzerimonas chloritidismutans AW-1 TaxID=1263865 RepID=V4Q3N0_STUCH|nr:hypothetical protein F753_21650 [Stutzerimonas chloritidismutans AW-1]
MDLGTAQVVEVRPLLPAIGLFLVLFLLLIGGGAWLVEKRVLKPLRQLRRSASCVAAPRRWRQGNTMHHCRLAGRTKLVS